MRDFIKFIVVKVFLTGARKFFTMAAIAYGLYSLGNVPQVKKIVEYSKKAFEDSPLERDSNDSERGLASEDSLNLKMENRSYSNFSKKKKDFFDDSDGSKIETDVENSVNEFVNDLGQKQRFVDRSRGIASDVAKADTDKNIEDTDSEQADLLPSDGCIGASCSPVEIIKSEDEEDDDEPVRTVLSTPPKTIDCTADKAEGLYGSNILVNLSCSETANITYCVQTGGSCCDPYNSPTEYTGSINLNAGDAEYCVSFYGISNDGGSSTTTDLTYTIDSTLPALIVDFPRIQTQSTELPILNQTQSSDYGKANHFYTQVNLKSHDPTGTGLNWSCDDIKNMYTGLVTPSVSVIQPELATEGLTTFDQIDQSIGASDLDVGDNYVVTLFEDKTREIVSCQVQKIVLEDTFNAAFTGTGSTPVFTGVRKTAGGFVGFGHFQVVPNSTLSGSNENQQSLTVNKTDLFNIIY